MKGVFAGWLLGFVDESAGRSPAAALKGCPTNGQRGRFTVVRFYRAVPRSFALAFYGWSIFESLANPAPLLSRLRFNLEAPPSFF
jgi:hypothetical protein